MKVISNWFKLNNSFFAVNASFFLPSVLFGCDHVLSYSIC